jgi:hypothetical protein
MSFETKDSGKREQFDSGMQRDTQEGKARFDLVYPGPMLKRWAELMGRGAEKYTANNWLKAEGDAEAERFKASAARHFAQWMNGETDEDHAAAVFFNINGYEYVTDRRAQLLADVDDKEAIAWRWSKTVGRHRFNSILCDGTLCEPYTGQRSR